MHAIVGILVVILIMELTILIVSIVKSNTPNAEINTPDGE